MFFQWFPIAHVLWAQEARCVPSPCISIQAMWCPKMFCNLLQDGDGTSAKKLDEDLDILWGQKVAM